jgi:hypothetical protein
MRAISSALSIALVLVFLAGCAAGSVPLTTQNEPATVVPSWLYAFQTRAVPHRAVRYAGKMPKGGVYAAEFYGIDLYGYRFPNQHDAGPICKIAATSVNGFAVDSGGELVVPNGDPSAVSVYRGHALCGKPMGSFADPYGQASDAATANAATGTIVVGNIRVSASEKVGNVAVCTLAKGCTKKLTSKAIKYYGGGVALAGNGDCWIASEDNPSLSSSTLTYFKGCSGSGEAAKGWKNVSYGGVIIDKAGNLIAVDSYNQTLWVYGGCNPSCTVVGGPFTLEGSSFYGSLNRKGTELALGDWQLGQVDVYAYEPTSLTYLYSFGAGLSPSNAVNAAAFSPSL